MRGRNLHESNTEEHADHQPLAQGEAQRPEEWQRHDDEHHIRKCANARIGVQKVDERDALPLNGKVPCRLHGVALEDGDEDGADADAGAHCGRCVEDAAQRFVGKDT